MTGHLTLDALLFGLFCGFALPLGALTILIWNPSEKWTAALLAFGGGALLAALTIDLVASTLEHGHFFSMAIGAIAGGLIYEGSNRVLNEYGGFLRKASITLRHLRKQRASDIERLALRLATHTVFNKLPADIIRELLYSATARQYQPGTTVLRQGEPGDAMYIIESGSIDVVDVRQDMKLIRTLGPDDILGEMALLTGAPRSATAICRQPTRAWMITRDDFGKILQSSDAVREQFNQLVENRLKNLEQLGSVPHEEVKKWTQTVARQIRPRSIHIATHEIREEADKHKGAPMAIWMGNLLDCIPESLVVGASILNASISLSLLAGLFLSNYPEALSSSAGMKEQKMPTAKIILMWGSLCLVTGLGAVVGNLAFSGAGEQWFSLFEGLAAGAMLTMIAETMLPEAFEKGGSVTGLSTLAGFLIAVFFQTLK